MQRPPAASTTTMNSLTESLRPPQTGSPKSHIRLTPVGLAILCVSLVVATSFVTHRFGGASATPSAAPATAPSANPTAVNPPGTPAAPWGDLVTVDIKLEQPEEYVSFENSENRETQWVFSGTAAGTLRQLLGGCGFTAPQLDQTLAPQHLTDTATGVVVKPPAEVVLGLAPAAREKLYTLLAKWPENKPMAEPYHLPIDNPSSVLAESGLPEEMNTLLEKLSYVRKGHRYFSDADLLLNRLPDRDSRLKLLKALTNQTAVLARLRVGPDTDIDKLLGYWGTTPGVRSKDLRPLFESVRAAPGGGTISLLYLLPKFARERLYTFPLPQQEGSPRLDCHWTALNFFHDVPDDRLQDNAYASNHIKEHFYQIGKPSACGDLIFVTNPQGEVIHSAVYIAADLCFTKNGVNFAQPWILMRLERLRDVYTFDGEPNVLYYRRKES